MDPRLRFVRTFFLPLFSLYGKLEREIAWVDMKLLNGRYSEHRVDGIIEKVPGVYRLSIVQL